MVDNNKRAFITTIKEFLKRFMYLKNDITTEEIEFVLLLYIDRRSKECYVFLNSNHTFDF